MLHSNLLVALLRVLHLLLLTTYWWSRFPALPWILSFRQAALALNIPSDKLDAWYPILVGAGDISPLTWSPWSPLLQHLYFTLSISSWDSSSFLLMLEHWATSCFTIIWMLGIEDFIGPTLSSCFRKLLFRHASAVRKRSYFPLYKKKSRQHQISWVSFENGIVSFYQLY